jgi:hypothetical protein
VWDALERNPWASLPAREIAERGPGSPAGRGEARRGRGSDPQDEGPGPFALADEQIVRELLEGAGLADVVVETLDLVRTHRSFDELWETTLDLSRRFHDAVLGRPEGEIEEIKRSLETRFEPYAADDGSLAIPARTLVASAAA